MPLDAYDCPPENLTRKHSPAIVRINQQEEQPNESKSLSNNL